MQQPSRRLLVTGGAGFIGSNFVRYWSERYLVGAVAAPLQDRIVVLDALTYAGNRQNLIGIDQHAAFRFVQGDIGDRALVETILRDERIDTIVHFAAESHVDRSILGAKVFVQTNVVGTLTLLEAFRQHWCDRGQPSSDRFIHISTDEVYGTLGLDDAPFSETTAYAPNSPYAASKAGSDHLVRAYHQTYGIPTVITHSSNNYGAYQFPEKLIPLMCINIMMGKPLPIYGDGQQIRDWLHVYDHCRALDSVIHHGQSGETYNIGGNNEVKNLDLVTQICNDMDELAPDLPVRPSHTLITFVSDRPGHDRRYAIDITKIKTELGWMPEETITTGLRRTVEWYLTHSHWWQPLLSDDYRAFYQQLYGDVLRS